MGTQKSLSKCHSGLAPVMDVSRNRILKMHLPKPVRQKQISNILTNNSSCTDKLGRIHSTDNYRPTPYRAG